MKNYWVIVFITFLAIACWGLWHSTKHYPKPMRFWDSYGFEVGGRYLKEDITENPFAYKQAPDTVTVTEIRGSWLKVAGAKGEEEVYRLHSVGMDWSRWSKIINEE